MVGMLAAAGAMDQVGRAHFRVQGDIADDGVFAKVQTSLRAAVGASRLRGETFGLYGGRPMGMYTAVAGAGQWRRGFGIGVEATGESGIIRGRGLVAQVRVGNALQ